MTHTLIISAGEIEQSIRVAATHRVELFIQFAMNFLLIY
jgi:hypothetical protein